MDWFGAGLLGERALYAVKGLDYVWVAEGLGKQGLTCGQRVFRSGVGDDFDGDEVAMPGSLEHLW